MFPSSEAVSNLVPSGEKAALPTRAAWPRRVRGRKSCCTSHSFAVASLEVVTAQAPFEENAAKTTRLLWPWRVFKHTPVLESQTFAEQSSEAVSTSARGSADWASGCADVPAFSSANALPSDPENTAAFSCAVCPATVERQPPDSMLHNFAVLSADAVNTTSASGENTAESTRELCPLNLRNTLPVATPQTLADESSEAHTRSAPSKELCTEFTAALCPRKVNRHSPPRRSQSLTVWSAEALATSIVEAVVEEEEEEEEEAPSRRATEFTAAECPVQFTHSCAPALQMRTMWSPQAVRISDVDPGKKIAALTGPLWPFIVHCTTLVLASASNLHNLAVRSSEAVSTTLASCENSAELTGPLCPRKVCTHCPRSATHNLALLSADPVSTCRPSGQNATERTQLVWPRSVCRRSCPCAVHAEAVQSTEAVKMTSRSSVCCGRGGFGGCWSIRI
mmetsp:Transcript_91524/g.296260  ORF Transcript_91524/g.296260 Transcript_91524/m.296260 type:complete len:451 (-) Transcript_91524:883-2235(-)